MIGVSWQMLGMNSSQKEKNLVKMRPSNITESMLICSKVFLKSGAKSNNIKATLQPHLKSIENLSDIHRAPVAPPLTALSAPGPLATHGPNCTIAVNKDQSNMVPSIPMHMSNASVLTLQKDGPLIYPGQIQQFRREKLKKRSFDLSCALHAVITVIITLSTI